MAEQLALTRAARSGLTTNPNRMVRQQVPAFLNKLYSMVNDAETDELIHWSESGDSFFVPNHERFGRELLPKFFKHGNFSSFVRQLNMYGFHKVPHLQQGVLQNETETELWQFVNAHFQRGQPDLLVLIQRKKAAGGSHQANALDDFDGDGSPGAGPSTQGSGNHSINATGPGALDVGAVANGLAAIKRHQATISAELKDLQQSNSGLWQEALAARERHKKHQDTINKILRFLAGVFGSTAPQSPASTTGRSDDHGSSGGGAMVVRRKKPRLMIEDGDGGDANIINQGQKHQANGVPGDRAKLEEAIGDDPEEDNLLISIDEDEDEDEDESRGGQLTGIGSPMEASPVWSSGRLESVASTPVGDTFQKESSIAQQSGDMTPRSRPLLPKTGPNLSASPVVPSNPSSSSFTTFTAPHSPNMSSESALQNPPLNSLSNQSFSSSADQAAFQQSLDNLLGDPNSFQRMLNAMAGPANGMPSIPPMPPNFNQPSTNTLDTNMFPNSVGTGSSVFDSLNQNNQMIAAGADTLGYLPAPSGSAMDLGLSSGRSLSPNSVLALLSGQGNNGSATPKGHITPPLNSSVADTLSSQSNRLQKVYTDAETINADVDAIQNSINSLIEGMGLDPMALANLSEGTYDPSSQGAHVGDFDSFLNQFANSSSVNGQPSLDPNSFSFNGVDGGSQLQPAFDLDPFHSNSEDISGSMAQYPSAFLDEVGTNSTTSSPRTDMHDDVQVNASKDLEGATRNSTIQSLKRDAAKGSKRKSDMADLDVLPHNASPKGTRLRRKK